MQQAMKWRITLGAVMIAVMSSLFVWDAKLSDGPIAGMWTDLLARGFIVAAVVAVIMSVGAWELYRLAKAGGYAPSLGVMISATLILPAYALAYFYVSASTLPTFHGLLGLFFIPVCAAQFVRGTTERALRDVAITLFGVMYLGYFGAYLVELRVSHGPWALPMLLMMVKGGDVGAYFTGSLIGKHKLAPWLSPGKTIEGLVGALIFSAALAVAFNKILAATVCEPSGFLPLGTVGVAITGAIMGGLGHFGDLIESLIKRDCAVKDSAKLLPAFGGVLDLVDSLLPTAMVWSIILKLMLG